MTGLAPPAAAVDSADDDDFDDSLDDADLHDLLARIESRHVLVSAPAEVRGQGGEHGVDKAAVVGAIEDSPLCILSQPQRASQGANADADGSAVDTAPGDGGGADGPTIVVAIDDDVYLDRLAEDEVRQLDATRRELAMPPLARFRQNRHRHRDRRKDDDDSDSRMTEAESTVVVSPDGADRRPVSQDGRLSVTDIVGPMWCEAQFEYSLEKRGRKRRTAAMKRGAKIHDDLERAVHTPVAVDLDDAVPEERWGLRLFNARTGCDELFQNGLTRELGVLGQVDGTHVSGVVDELRLVHAPAEVQQQSVERMAMRRFLNVDTVEEPMLVLSDTKTRVSTREPTRSAVDQVRLQLMLYRTLLADMAQLNILALVEREGLDPDRPFSDGFLAQVMSLQLDADAADELLQHNSVRGFWTLLQPRLDRLRRMLQRQAGVTVEVDGVPQRLPDLKVTYVHQATRAVLTEASFVHDEAWMRDRVGAVLQWWRGKRPAKGVDPHDTFKCRICEFEQGCAWREARANDAVHRFRQRRLDQGSGTA